MIQETVNAILEAEAKAGEITAQAADEAKLIVQNADGEADKLRSETVEKVKAERKKVADSAENEGNAEYQKILLAGNKQTDKLLKTTDVTKAAEFIKEKVISGYGNR